MIPMIWGIIRLAIFYGIFTLPLWIGFILTFIFPDIMQIISLCTLIGFTIWVIGFLYLEIKLKRDIFKRRYIPKKDDTNERRK